MYTSQQRLSVGSSHLWDYFWVRQQETKQVGVAPVEVGDPGHTEAVGVAGGPDEKVTDTVYRDLLEGNIRRKEA